LLKENNTRKGFFEHGDFLAVRGFLPEYLRKYVTFAYKSGWRASEISSLTWSQVDLHQGIVRLEVGETKNDKGRTVYLDEELKEVFRKQWEARKKSKKLLPYVFLNKEGDDKIKAKWLQRRLQLGISTKKELTDIMANSSNLKKNFNAEAQNRTGDTRIFSPLLYRLSYLGR